MVDSCWFSRVGLRRLIVRQTRGRWAPWALIVAVVMAFFAKATWTYILLRCRLLRRAMKHGLGWVGRSADAQQPAVILLLIHMRYAWQGDAVGT